MTWILMFFTLFSFSALARDYSSSAKIRFNEIKATDKVVIIKAISSTKKTFLVRLGLEDGIGLDQTALFSNKLTTISARAIEVASTSSLWEVRDERSVAPFDKNDIVVFTNNLERRPFEIPELSRVEERLVQLEKKKSRDLDTFAMRGSLTRAMSESTTESTAESAPTRQGYQFEAMYMRNFADRWEYSIGVRIDQEIATLQDPSLDIPTSRLLGTFDLLYHFHSDLSRPHYYGSIGLAYGRSSTEVNGITSSGTAVILPIARLGKTFDWFTSTTFFGELAFESISMSETSEASEEQITTIISGKLSLGIRF